MRTFGALLAAALALAAAGPPAASGATARQLAPGVFAAPDTPAGKEYALRLQQARSTGSQPRTSHPSAPSLFGAGIAAAHSSTATRAARAKAHDLTASRASSAPAPDPSSSSGTAAPAAVGAIPPASGSSGGGGLALVGGAGAVLVLACLGGLLLRRRRSPGPDA